MSASNILFYIESQGNSNEYQQDMLYKRSRYMAGNLKTTKLLLRALIEVCAVIMSNTVYTVNITFIYFLNEFP